MTKLEDGQELNALLSFLKGNRGFDFTGYKTASLERRIQKRMQAIQIPGYPEYIDYLQVHPEEYTQLFNTILINVTSFFRDPPAWEHLSREILPQLLENRKPGEDVRVWSTGCASGEEAFSIAMLLAEAIGEVQFRERVKIYATDVDEPALNKARLATYTEKDIEGVPDGLKEKYFFQNGSGYGFHKDLRRCIIFGRNDLIQDAPISRVDLLVCRNTLMYFNAETQSKILARFHFALRESGYLFLGKAEMLLTHTHIFTPVDLKLRIFTKVPKVNLRDRLLIMTHGESDDEGTNSLTSLERVQESAFESTPIAQLIFDLNHTMVLANAQARSLFGLDRRDFGRPIQDLELSYRPIKLRASIDKALDQRHPVIIREVEWPNASNNERYYDVRIQPLLNEDGRALGIGITFSDVTQPKLLQRQIEQAHHELETAFEELQSTNEELETTNEELQSTNEELETTNEELQSTNEELETMNEELQSTNEELHTINEELQELTNDLNRLNSFLEAVLTGVQSGVIVLDRDLRIQAWNRKAEDLWGLRADEVIGNNFLNLDIGLPVERLKKPFHACLSGEVDFRAVVLEARNRRGKVIQCRVTCAPFNTLDREIHGVIALMEELDHQPHEDGSQP